MGADLINMKWTASISSPKPLRFVIEHDELVGFYLYVYEGDWNSHDYLQDTRYFAKEQAFEEFGVPLDAWVRTE